MRLWAKIFLWFWLAMSFVAASLALSVYLTRPGLPAFLLERPSEGRWRRFTGETVGRQTRTVVEAYRGGGAAAAQAELKQLEEERGLVASLYGPGDQLIAGPALPPADLDVLARARTSRRPAFRESGSDMLVARRTGRRSGGNEGMVLVAWFPRPGAGPDPIDLAVRLLAVLVPGGILCYGLARYLTSPAAKLQQAVRRLASGQLEARVDPALRKRRDELGDLGRDFDAMAERIERLVESQNRLIRDISHELRSPLARLSLALELARRRAGEEAAESMDRIELESERMNELIGRLLSLSGLEANGKSLPGESVDLSAVLARVVEDASFEAAGRCRVRLDAGGESTLTGSAELLRSALDNVVRNAVRYSPEGGEVRVRLESDGPGAPAVVLVEDEGPGVPEDRLEDIFQPFARVDEARDRDSGGTGLGLAIASRVIRLHGGTIEAQNSNPGLRIRIEIPAGEEKQSSAEL